MAHDPEFSFEHPDLKEDHTLSLNPAIWIRLNEIAKRHYGGGVSKAVEGLALHEWMVEAHRLARGEGVNDHWISAPLVMRPGELAPVLRRLLQGDVDYVGSYFDAKVNSRTSAEVTMLRARVAELEERERSQGKL